MQNIYRMRLLVKFLDEYTKQNRKFAQRALGYPFKAEQDDIINGFHKDHKYTIPQIEEVLASAIAREYIIYADTEKIPQTQRRIAVSPLKGRNLLTFTGYVNELADSVGKIPPLLTWFVSLLSLTVAILVAIYK
jgi:hypothetical protein